MKAPRWLSISSLAGPACMAAAALIAPLALLEPAHAQIQKCHVEVVDGANAAASKTISVALSWRNAWHTERNHDSIWLTLRLAGKPEHGALQLAQDGHRIAAGNATVEVARGDRLGCFVVPPNDHRGDLACRLELQLVTAVDPHQVQAWAVEMVAVPGGAFDLGDDDPSCVALGAFFRVGDDGKPAGCYRVEPGKAILVGQASGRLGYDRGPQKKYRGDLLGPIPTTFPNGTQPFYVMKRELTQGEYARFLNALPSAARIARGNQDATGAESETLSITQGDASADGRFIAANPDRPCNFLSWRDSCAWLDWMCLRPMTELEFEKAARGPQRPCPGDYPWGTASREGLLRKVTRERDLEPLGPEFEAKIDHDHLVAAGASYYRILDLSGSLWERVISAGHATGRAFRGTHGDGVLDAQGNGTNADWPQQASAQEAPGIGFRGGAEYFSKPDLTNPSSPVAVRTYAAYDGSHRYKTYSARGARSR